MLPLWYIHGVTSNFHKIFVVSYIGAAALFLAPSGRAQFANLDQLGEQFAKELKHFKPKLVAVADLNAAEGALPSQGHYFAQFLTSSIRQHSKKKLSISDHANFDAAMKRANLSPATFVTPDTARTLSGRFEQEILIVGTIGRDEHNCIFSVSALRVSNGAVLFSRSTTVRRTEFVDSFSEPFPPKMDQPVFSMLSTHQNLSVPICIHCPDPEYNDLARREKVSGTAVFNVLVSTEGRVVSLQPVRMIGYGLDEVAFNTIKTWKLKPASNKDGIPVNAIVLIEVSFRLY
jgi:TonB family protein